MFDRLGRRDDETPFVLRWFAENGIEIWSVKEDLSWCDTVVFASPVHFAYMTAQLRAVIDRLWAWFNLPGNFGAKRKSC